jgi:hypothetical protein
MARDESPPDFTDWVSATETYNYCNKNPLIDWLNLCGTNAGFVADSRRPGYDKRFDYVSFMLRQSCLIETTLPERPVGTLETMAGAWSAASEAAERQVPLEQTAQIQMIARFSRDLCRSMMETLVFLRKRAQSSLGQAA